MIKVFVNGCFDVLHPGHMRLFSYARSLGDHLTVAIDSDTKVALDKGSDRPINNEQFRKEMLLAIRWIDRVEIFNTPKELSDIVYLIETDIMVVGSDWKGRPIVGSEHVGKVFYFDRIADYSSTKTIQSILSRGKLS